MKVAFGQLGAYVLRAAREQTRQQQQQLPRAPCVPAHTHAATVDPESTAAGVGAQSPLIAFDEQPSDGAQLEAVRFHAVSPPCSAHSACIVRFEHVDTVAQAPLPWSAID